MARTWDTRDSLAAAAVSNIIAENQDAHVCRYARAWHFSEGYAGSWNAHYCEVCSICDGYKCEVE